VAAAAEGDRTLAQEAAAVHVCNGYTDFLNWQLPYQLQSELAVPRNRLVMATLVAILHLALY